MMIYEAREVILISTCVFMCQVEDALVYRMEWAEKPDDDDNIIVENGVKVLVDTQPETFEWCQY